MSNAFEVSPYSTSYVGTGEGEIRTVSANPFEYFARGKQLLGEDYWTFVLVTFVGFFIGSIVPFGILWGPMMVGIYMCIRARERGEKVEVGMVFNGFDRFVDALLVLLILMALGIAIFVPFVILMVVAVAALNAMGGDPAWSGMVGIVALPFAIVVALGANLPVMFCYQLIADRHVPAVEAVKQSFRGSWKNLLGVILFLIANGIISSILMSMCIIPFFLFLPISLAGMFVYYRDVFGGEQHA